MMTEPDTPRSGAIVTAFFDSRDNALRAMDRLSAIGLRDDRLRLTEGQDPHGSAATEERGFMAALHDLFFPDDDRATYEEGLSRGGFLLTARDVPADLYDTAVDVLDDEGAVDIDERATAWRGEGWTGASTAASYPPPVADVESGTSGMAGMDTPHSGVTADRNDDRNAELRAEAGESRGTVTAADRRGDMWTRDMARGRPRVRTYMAVPPLLEGEDDDAVERNNLPS